MESLTSPLLRGRTHRASSTSKVLEDESKKVHRSRHSHSHTRSADKDRGKEKERDKERVKEKEKLKSGMKEERPVKVRKLSLAEREREGGHESKKEKGKHKLEGIKWSEKYDHEKAEKKARRRERSAGEEKETERPKSAPLDPTEQNLEKYGEVEKKRGSSKSKELIVTTRLRDASNVSTEDCSPRRSRSTKDDSTKLPKSEKRTLTLQSYTNEKEKREQERAMAIKKRKGQEDLIVKKKSSSKDKGKERVQLGFDLDNKDKMIQCVSCLSDDISQHDAALLACGHYFCNDCLKELFRLSLRDPVHMPPRCCTEDHIPLQHAENLLSYREKKEWNSKYQEFTTANRIYCPATDCGAWIREKDMRNKRGRCPKCNTEVCTLCHSKAHGIDECPKDEELKAFVEAAKAHGYQRCFNCRAVVELEKGCNHITCRCTAEFCYLCGEKWKSCECPWFNYEPESDDEEEEIQEYGRNANRRLRGQERQIAEDEAFARRLAHEEVRENSRGGREINNTHVIALSGIGHEIRGGVKKLTDRIETSASRHDEDTREERIRQRAQRGVGRDTARRGNHLDERKVQRKIDLQQPERREDVAKEGRRSKLSREPTARASTTESVHHVLTANEERAAFIRRYILGDDLGPEVPSDSTTRRPHTSYGLLSPAVSAESSSTRRTSAGRSRRSSEAGAARIDARHSTGDTKHPIHTTSPSNFLRSQARLGPYSYTTSPATCESTSPSAPAAAPSNSKNPSILNSNYTNTKSSHTTASNALANGDANTNPHHYTNTNTPNIVTAATSSNEKSYQRTDTSRNTQLSQEKVGHQNWQQPQYYQQLQPGKASRSGTVPAPPPPSRSTTYPLPIHTPYSYRIDSMKPLAAEEYTRPYTSHGWEGTSFQARRPSWSPLPESFANRIQVTAGGTVLLPRKY